MVLLVVCRKLGRENLVSLATTQHPQYWTATHPKIRGASVEIQLQGLGWCTNLNLAQIFRIVLLVFRSHLAGLAVRSRFDKLVLAAETSTTGNVRMSEATLVQMGSMAIGTRFGRLEAEAVEEIYVGFRAMGLVVLVGNGLDLLQAQLLSQLGLGCERSLHDCFSSRQGEITEKFVGVGSRKVLLMLSQDTGR